MAGDATIRRAIDARTEDAWLASLRSGHLSAFDAIYLAFVPSLYRFAQRLVAADVAEDVVQDVMIDLWERRETLVVRGTLRGYLFGAVRRRAADVRRRAGVVERHAAESVPSDAVPSPERELEAGELMQAVDAALAALPERSRLILTLRWADGLSYPEIAEVLEITEDAAKKQGRRMELLLRSVLARFAPP